MAFPDTFRWGVTSSSLQSEGVAPCADWSSWERSGKAPRSLDGSGLAVDFHDDFALLRTLGLTDVRLTIEWARIEPIPGRIDNDAIDLYSDIVRAARHNGLRPWLTLQSTTLPGWFNEDEAGFRDNRMRNNFWLPHVERCAEAFGASAEGFTPIDDPIGWALRGYHLGNRPPGLRDAQKFRDAVLGALEADHGAAQLLQSNGFQTMAVRGVPTVFGLDPGAEPHVRFWTGFLFDTWIDALDSGEFHIPDADSHRRESWTQDFDFVGLSFDHPIAISGTGALSPYPVSARCADNGFAPLPEELGVLIERMAERLPDRRFIVAANGLSTTDDDWREEVLRETLDVLETMVEEGYALDGYFHDTGIDGYEFRKGFETHRGLIGRDRHLKESAQFLARTISSSSSSGGDQG